MLGIRLQKNLTHPSVLSAFHRLRKETNNRPAWVQKDGSLSVYYNIMIKYYPTIRPKVILKTNPGEIRVYLIHNLKTTRKRYILAKYNNSKCPL